MKLKNAVTAIFCGALLIFILIFQGEISSSIYSQVLTIIKTVIPPLFATSIVASVLQRIGVFGKSSLLNSFIFGNIGGYIIGAKTIKELEISNKSKALLMIFSFSSGPSFSLLSSTFLFKTPMIGLISYLSQVLINLLFMIAIKRRITDSTLNSIEKFSSRLVCDSVKITGLTMINVISMSAFFSILNPILKKFPKEFLLAFWDISNLGSIKVNIFVYSALLAFGGICVSFQIFSILDEIKIIPFLITRPIFVILSSLITHFTCEILDISVSVSSANIEFAQDLSITPLLCCIAMFILTIKKTRINARL